MQNSKTGRNLDGFMGTASHNTSYEGEGLRSSKATFDDYGDKRLMRIDHFEERLRSWHVFHRILERFCSTKVIAGFSLRMYTILIPPYIFSSAN